MTTSFPSGLDALTNPTSSNTQDSPSHSGQHANANDAIEALEAKVGVDGSAVTTSLDYLVAQLRAGNPAPYFPSNVPFASSDDLNTTFAPGANTMVATFFILEQRQTLNCIGTKIVNSSGNACAAILDNDGTAGRGNTRLSTSGSVACPATGFATISITPVALDPGFYWAAIAFDNGTVELPYKSTSGSPFSSTAPVRCDKASAFPIPSTVGAAAASPVPYFIVPGYV